MIPFQMIVLAQFWIHIPLPLMIYPGCIKDPATPLICSHLPSLLPLKVMLVIWPPLLICHESSSYLMMILTLAIQRIKMNLAVAGLKYDTALVNMMKKCTTKKRLYCSTWSNKDKKFYYCHWFSRINSDNINFFVEYQQCMEQRFCWSLCLSFFHPLFHLLNSFLCMFSYCSVDHFMFQYLWMLCLKCWPCIFLLTFWMHMMTTLSTT